MVNIFELDMPVVEVKSLDYAARLAACDPVAMQEQRGAIFEERPLDIFVAGPVTTDLGAALTLSDAL